VAIEFRAYSVVDGDGDFLIAIMTPPDDPNPPFVPIKYQVKGWSLIAGIPPRAWMRWALDHWENRPGLPPLVREDGGAT